MATIPASNPLSSAKRSARTRMQPPGATKTSRTASCCPWSTSPSVMRSTTAPVLSQLIPTWRRTRGSSQFTNFGDTTPALERNDSSTSLCTASGSSATSSWQEQEERRSLHHAEGLVGRGGVAGAARQMPDEGVGEDPGHPFRDPGIVLPGRQDEDRQLLVVLGRQGGERLFEPGPGSGRDHDGDHGRHLGVHQGAEAIRSGIHPFRHEMHLQCLLLFNIRDTLVSGTQWPAGGSCVPNVGSEPTRQEAPNA